MPMSGDVQQFIAYIRCSTGKGDACQKISQGSTSPSRPPRHRQCAYSVAGNTITVKRSSLSDENAENIMFLHSNQHLSAVTALHHGSALVKILEQWW